MQAEQGRDAIEREKKCGESDQKDDLICGEEYKSASASGSGSE